MTATSVEAGTVDSPSTPLCSKCNGEGVVPVQVCCGYPDWSSGGCCGNPIVDFEDCTACTRPQADDSRRQVNTSHTDGGGTPTLQAFGAWLREQPQYVEFCPPGRLVSESCPLACFSGVQCSPSYMGFLPMPPWGARFMDNFDSKRNWLKPADKAIALTALELTERDFLPDEVKP